MSDTKKCISCGNKLNSKAIFCPSCGTKQEEIKVQEEVKKQEEIKINKIARKPRPKVKTDLTADVIKDIEQTAVKTVPSPKKEITEPVVSVRKKEEPIVETTENINKEPLKEQLVDIEVTKETTTKITTEEKCIKEEEIVEEKTTVENTNLIEESESSISTEEVVDTNIVESNTVTEEDVIEDPLMLAMGVDENIEIIEIPAEEINEEKSETENALIKADELTPRLDLNEKELMKYAQKKLKDISIDDNMETTLFPLIAKSVRGFRCTFLSSMGTSKEQTLEDIAQLLYDIGKVDSPKCEWIGFSEIPKKFDVKKVYVIDDLQSAISYLFNLEDFSENASEQQKFYQDLMEQLINAPRNAYIFLSSKPAEYRGFLPLDARLTFIFDHAITFPDLTNEEICERFKALIPDTHIKQIDKQFEKDFIGYLDRNRRFFPFENSELAVFLANYAIREDEIKLPKEKFNPKGLEETFAKIIGMENVKDQVRELNQYLSVRQNLEKAGAKLPDFNMHMMFLGNPGVGKTSIARVISKVLFDLGYCREEKLVEVTSKDLVGAYGNQTGIKTNRVIMRALGGVLFIDEAYSLSNSCGQAGAEAIAIIIKAMMDYKNDLVVMFAGYNLEMRTFVESNSGISSRINYIFKFEDYSPEELYDIFMLKLGFIGMTLHPNAEEPVKKLCKFASGRRNAGNGRFVDNLIQKALTKHALLNLSGSEILVLGKESIPTVEDIMKTVF
jgi:hypothetical protein